MNYDAMINGHPVIASLDPGATHLFMSTESAKRCGLPISNAEFKEVELGDGSTVPILGKTKAQF